MQRHPSEYGPACRMPSIAQTPMLAWHRPEGRVTTQPIVYIGFMLVRRERA